MMVIATYLNPTQGCIRIVFSFRPPHIPRVAGDLNTWRISRHCGSLSSSINPISSILLALNHQSSLKMQFPTFAILALAATLVQAAPQVSYAGTLDVSLLLNSCPHLSLPLIPAPRP
jgi:hypothetical protein